LIPNYVYNVLHVDDDNNQLKFTKLFLEQDKKIKVTPITSPTQALEAIPNSDYECIITDYKMPEMDGITFAKKALELCDLPVIIYTGQGSEEVAQAAFAAGVSDYFRKEMDPSHYQVLEKRIIDVINHKHSIKELADSENRYHKMFDNTIHCVAVYKQTEDGDFAFLDFNHSAEKVDKIRREELLGRKVTEVFPGVREMGMFDVLTRVYETGVPEHMDETFYRDDRRSGFRRVYVYRIPTGEVVALYEDITERKKMEEHLRESEERYRSLVENSPNALSVTIGDTIVYANQKRALLSGKNDPSELVGTSALAQVAEGDREPIIKIREARERGENPPSPFEYRMLSADGSVRDLVDYNSEIKYQGQNAVQHMLNDVTEQRRYEKRLETLRRHATDLGKARTMDDVAERTLDAVKSVLGFNQSGFGVVEGNVLHFIHVIGVSVGEGFELPLDGKGVAIRAVRTGETQLVADTRNDEDYVDGPPGRRYGSLSELAVPVKVDGKVVAVVNVEGEKLDAFGENDKKLVEIFSEHVASAINRIDQMKKVQSSERSYRNLLETSLDPILILSETRIAYVNQQSVNLAGYDDASDLIGQDVSLILADDEIELLRRRTLSRQRGEPQPDRYMLKLVRKDGELRDVEVTVSLTNFEGSTAAFIIGRDVTQRKRDENRIMALHLHSASLAKASTYENVHKATLDAVESVIGFHFLSFLRVEREGLISVGSRGASPFNRYIPIDGKGITAKAARENWSVLVKDTRGDPDFLRGTTDSLSELAVPVVVDGETVAVINMESMQPNAFDETDQRLVETLATHVASAYQRIEESKRAARARTPGKLRRCQRPSIMALTTP
jgi:PAS domain S-box-containing protein